MGPEGAPAAVGHAGSEYMQLPCASRAAADRRHYATLELDVLVKAEEKEGGVSIKMNSRILPSMATTLLSKLALAAQGGCVANL